MNYYILLLVLLLNVDVSLSKAKEFLDKCITASKFDHPNVLKMIAVSVLQTTPLMVMPFMHNGSVQSYVKLKRGNQIKFSDFPEVLLLPASYESNSSYMYNFMFSYVYVSLPNQQRIYM